MASAAHDRRVARPAPDRPPAGEGQRRHLALEGRFADSLARAARLSQSPPGPQPIQRQAGSTFLPSRLKAGVERLSGIPMDDVRVAFDSPQPARISAAAYTQGSEIHLAPGAERHLAHEAWHVVQQKQGRVRSTCQLKGGARINDDSALEREADFMGALAVRPWPGPAVSTARAADHSPAARRVPPAHGIVQRAIHVGAKAMTADEAFEQLLTLVQFSKMDHSRWVHIKQVLTRMDFMNVHVADLVRLAARAQDEIQSDHDASGEVAPEHFVPPETGEVLILAEFTELAKKYKLPASVQHEVAARIEADAERLATAYELVADLVHEGQSSERIMKWLTKKVNEFALGVAREAAGAVAHPKIPFAILTAGSGARQETFPGSDLDLAIITDTKEQSDVAGLFHFMQYLEARIKATVKVLSRKLGAPEAIGLQADTGVFGFAKTPEATAQKTTQMQNVAQDAGVLAVKNDEHGALPKRFFGARDKGVNSQFSLGQLAERLVEFPVGKAIPDHFDIKRGFLRLPTLALRDLSQLNKIGATNSFDRIRELVKAGVIDAGLGKQLIASLETVARIRLKMHLFYKKEGDGGAIRKEVAAKGEYVLEAADRDALGQANTVLAHFHAALQIYVKAGGKGSLK